MPNVPLHWARSKTHARRWTHALLGWRGWRHLARISRRLRQHCVDWRSSPYGAEAGALGHGISQTERAVSFRKTVHCHSRWSWRWAMAVLGAPRCAPRSHADRSTGVTLTTAAAAPPGPPAARASLAGPHGSLWALDQGVEGCQRGHCGLALGTRREEELEGCTLAVPVSPVRFCRKVAFSRVWESVSH